MFSEATFGTAAAVVTAVGGENLFWFESETYSTLCVTLWLAIFSSQLSEITENTELHKSVRPLTTPV